MLHPRAALGFCGIWGCRPKGQASGTEEPKAGLPGLVPGSLGPVTPLCSPAPGEVLLTTCPPSWQGKALRCSCSLTPPPLLVLQGWTWYTCAGTQASAWTQATHTSATAKLATWAATASSRWTSAPRAHVRTGPLAPTTWEATRVRYGGCE